MTKSTTFVQNILKTSKITTIPKTYKMTKILLKPFKMTKIPSVVFGTCVI